MLYLACMKLIFPKDFKFGTSTACYQIETAVGHDWLGVTGRDGYVLHRTTDHEFRLNEDVDIIASLAPNYRMSLMWSKLQRMPYAYFDRETTTHYHRLLTKLKERKIDIMMVIHHFANPVWFARMKGWEKEKNISMWTNFAKKLVDEFGNDVSSWNTFNEPNLYTSMGWLAKEFPPFKTNVLQARSVIRNMAKAHDEIFHYIKLKYPQATVGISLNNTLFEGENIAGKIPASICDWLFMEYPASLFSKADFFGMSYYARIGFDPSPITFLNSPQKIRKFNKPHDDMWEYYPQGLVDCMERFWKQYRKPIVITENGYCSSDDAKRIGSIKDYMRLIHAAIQKGIPVHAYYHWTAWDNFEWCLGPTYQFGLYECDLETKERRRRPSADLYSSLAYSNEITV